MTYILAEIFFILFSSVFKKISINRVNIIPGKRIVPAKLESDVYFLKLD